LRSIAVTRFIAVATVSLAFVGCGSSEPGLVSVSGVVMLDDKPIGKAAVMFHHAAGRTAYGVTGEDGTFYLTTRDPGDGALIGDHCVTVSLTRQEGGVQQNDAGVEDYSRPILEEKTIAVVPKVYNDPRTSPINVTISKASKLRIDLESTRR
jgi:hypothetical protein